VPIIRVTHEASRIGLLDELSDSRRQFVFEKYVLGVPGMLLDLFDREPLLNILVQHFHD
jgi:hypothetical protein